MPYANNSDLPATAKELPSEAQSVFRRVFNQSHKDGKSESSAFAIAWTAVKNGWKKNSENKWEKINKSLDNSDKVDYNSAEFEIIRKDDSQRMVYGWASVVTKDGEPVVDLQGDIIEPEEMVLATTTFMKSERSAKKMHSGNQIGQVIHSFPLTYEIAKSLGIETKDEGWLTGIYVESDAVWEGILSGDVTSFSIGGTGTRHDA